MKKSDLKYWFYIGLLSFLPVVLFHIKMNKVNTLETLEKLSFFTTVILPLYLVILNFTLALKYKKLKKQFGYNVLIIFLAIFLSSYFSSNYNEIEYSLYGALPGIFISIISLILSWVMKPNEL